MINLEIIYIIIAVVISISGFYLSFSCYGDLSPPLGIRLIHALTAASLNILYIFYYLFGRLILGWTCN